MTGLTPGAGVGFISAALIAAVLSHLGTLLFHFISTTKISRAVFHFTDKNTELSQTHMIMPYIRICMSYVVVYIIHTHIAVV